MSTTATQPKSRWVLVSLLVVSIVLAISFFFYGLVRQIQAEQSRELAQRNLELAAKAQRIAEEQALLSMEMVKQLEMELTICKEGGQKTK